MNEKTAAEKKADRAMMVAVGVGVGLVAYVGLHSWYHARQNKALGDLLPGYEKALARSLGGKSAKKMAAA